MSWPQRRRQNFALQQATGMEYERTSHGRDDVALRGDDDAAVAKIVIWLLPEAARSISVYQLIPLLKTLQALVI